MLLNSTNFDWKPQKSNWYITYEACWDYKKEIGSLNGLRQNDIKLYTWLVDNIHKLFLDLNDDQKQRLRELNKGETSELSRTYMKKIVPAGVLEITLTDTWNINYEACWKYKKQNGSLKGLSKERKLYSWLKYASKIGELKDD